MWTSISKLFPKRNDHLGSNCDSVTDNMIDSQDSYDTRLAKQRASIKWLLSKAYNNQIPDNLTEPFYRDHENQEHLKPQIVRSLANAEYYCSALGNIYCDPNYHNLNHSTILGFLSRKSAFVSDSFTEDQITETILIQTNPLKMKAHMTVIESVMVLFAKEIVTCDRVMATIERFDHSSEPTSISPLPQDHLQSIFLWLNYANSALKKRLDSDSASDNNNGEMKRPPSLSLPYVKDLKDLCDGISCAALISFYCPDELNWVSIKSSSLPTISDSIHNLELVYRFCNESLPYSIFHMLPEDITYMRGSLQYNLVAFLADLFNVLEIHPAKCVRYPGSDKSKAVTQQPFLKRSLIQAPTIIPIPDLRSSLNSSPQINAFQVTKPLPVQMTIKNYHNNNKSPSECTDDSLASNDHNFVVHRSRGISTLSSLMMNSNNNRQNQDSPSSGKKIEDVTKVVAAGKPTVWKNNTGFNTITGRSRSRRNSTSDESQLTIENFCGSQDHINFIGRNPDKEPVAVSRKISAPAIVDFSNSPVRSSLQDSMSSINFIDSGRKDNPEISTNHPQLKRHLSSEAISQSLSQNFDKIDGDVTNSKNQRPSSAGSKTQSFDDDCTPTKRDQDIKIEKVPIYSNNTTTWREQNSNGASSSISEVVDTFDGDGHGHGHVTAMPQIHDIKLKLKEKRQSIENENRRMEVILGQQRLNLGKTAFFQAINKDVTSTSDSRNFDNYQQSIVQMNSSLDEIKADIQKLATQQSQLNNDQILAQQMESLILQQKQQQLTSSSFNHINQISNHQLIDNNYASSPQLSSLNYNQFYLHDQQHQHQQSPPHYQYQNQQPLMPPPSSTGGSHPRRTWNKSFNSNNDFDLNSITNQNFWNNNPMYDRNMNSFSLNTTNFEPQVNQVLINGANNHANLLSSPNPSKLFSGQKFNTISARTTQNQNQTNNGPTVISLQQMSKPQSQFNHSSKVTVHSAVVTPPEDDMTPQNISFIANNTEDNPKVPKKYNISFGSKTYRVDTTNRPALSPEIFQRPKPKSPPTNIKKVPVTIPSNDETMRSGTTAEIVSLEKSSKIDQGFYISFEGDEPKKPKPPLRSKRNLNRKEKAMSCIENGYDYLNNNDNSSNSSSNEMSIPKSCSLYNNNEGRDFFEGLIEKENKFETQITAKQPLVNGDSSSVNSKPKPNSAEALLIEDVNTNSIAADEMERKKERILMASLRRQQKIEEARERKEAEAQARKELELRKEEERLKRKEDQALKRAQILEQHKLKKAMEDDEKEGKALESLKSGTRLRQKNSVRKQRPLTIHGGGSDVNGSLIDLSSTKRKGSISNLTALSYNHSTIRRDYYRGSTDSLSFDQSYSQDPNDLDRNQSQPRSKYATLHNFKGRKSNSLMNLYGSQDSNMEIGGPGKSVASRITSPAMFRNIASPCSGPGSLPPGLISRRRHNNFDDTASDISSTHSSFMDYTGPKIYRQPNQKSNRSIILNAVEYCVFPGAVNKDAKQRVIDEIARADAKHFLILFRDAGCQYRALYAYYPETGEVYKLFGTGPKQVNDHMFDRFFKYNSGGKCFSQVHTKHLSVTIDAFTIQNSLWQGKKINLPNKKEMPLVI